MIPRTLRFFVVALSFAVIATPVTAAAQGRSREARAHAPGQQKKVSTTQALVVVRDVLTQRGYTIVRVESIRGMQVVSYRGNRGRGRGLGPVQRIFVRPAGDIVRIDAAPQPVLLDVRVRLGL